jgi:hypothetical protein
MDCGVTGFDHETSDESFVLTGIQHLRQNNHEAITVNDGAGEADQSGQRRLEALGTTRAGPPTIWVSRRLQ